MPVTQSVKARRFMNIYSATVQFKAAAKAREVEAAKAATLTSRAVFTSKLSGRPLAPPRTGRPTTGGAFADEVKWEAAGGGNIVFNQVALEAAAPYWLIQEIGTNRSATILNPPGSITVRSQYGRLISANLFWASGPGGTATDAGHGTGQQLYGRLGVKDAQNARQRRKRIRRQIEGKHYLQAGGTEGFIVLADGLLDDMKRIFK